MDLLKKSCKEVYLICEHYLMLPLKYNSLKTLSFRPQGGIWCLMDVLVKQKHNLIALMMDIQISHFVRNDRLFLQLILRKTSFIN